MFEEFVSWLQEHSTEFVGIPNSCSECPVNWFLKSKGINSLVIDDYYVTEERVIQFTDERFAKAIDVIDKINDSKSLVTGLTVLTAISSLGN